jgi:23S rRNA (guanine1835-N2)-methyltransferase
MNSKPINEIKRYPIRSNDPLQGWDSADELILQHLEQIDLKGKRILIINDQFGALSKALMDLNCSSYTDSYVSTQGILYNLNQRIVPINHLKKLSGRYDLVLLRLPKNTSFFEDILCHLSHHLHDESSIICGSMVKYLSASYFELLKKYIGPTTTSLAHKKARLIFANFLKGPTASPYPLSVKVESLEKPLINHSNLFSRDKLDIGTRFFLEHVPANDDKNILDLGCANGIIGIKAKMLNPQAKIIFSDESAMAIESAKINYHNYFSDEAQFIWTNCFEGQPQGQLDLILCNPPFHQGNTIGDFVARQMFQDSLRSLRAGGKIRVIGNSHLGYQMKLKKIFGNSKIIATNKKFIICDAIK